MCTLVMLWRPAHDWPLLVAGNRDEMATRPSSPPKRHWAARPAVVGGLDHLGGGTWFGLNDHGLAVAVMNREGTLGRASDKRSRGELVLDVLDRPDADSAASWLSTVKADDFRGFNLFVADALSAFWARGDAETAPVPEIHALPTGLHMLSARDLDDETLPRIRNMLPRFRAAAFPDPESGDWAEWIALLAQRSYSEREGPYSAMTLDLPNGFCTRSSHLLALPRRDSSRRAMFLHADGAPDRVPFVPVEL